MRGTDKCIWGLSVNGANAPNCSGNQKLSFIYSGIEPIFKFVHFFTVPTKSLETACHFPLTYNYNKMSYQI